MSKITFGPFFSTVRQMEPACPAIANLGVQMEWASAAKSMQVQLFHERPQNGRMRLEHLLFAQRKLDFDVPFAQHRVVQTSSGVFLPLEGLLIGLYERHDVSRHVQHVLEELASMIPLENRVCNRMLEPGYLVAEAESQGCMLNTVIPEGDQVYAELAWRANSRPCRFHAGICRFGLDRAGAVNAGTWLPAGTVTVGTLLVRDLHRYVRGAPLEVFSPQGISLLENKLRVAVRDKAKHRQTRKANEKPGIGVSGPL
jgi:hypothetical protein